MATSLRHLFSPQECIAGLLTASRTIFTSVSLLKKSLIRIKSFSRGKKIPIARPTETMKNYRFLSRFRLVFGSAMVMKHLSSRHCSFWVVRKIHNSNIDLEAKITVTSSHQMFIFNPLMILEHVITK